MKRRDYFKNIFQTKDKQAKVHKVRSLKLLTVNPPHCSGATTWSDLTWPSIELVLSNVEKQWASLKTMTLQLRENLCYKSNVLVKCPTSGSTICASHKYQPPQGSLFHPPRTSFKDF